MVASQKGSFSFAEVAKHNSPDDGWMVIHNKVYDVSNYTTHPGGDFIDQGLGRDATALFEGTHPSNAHEILKKFYIGELTVEDRITKYTWDSEFYKTLRKRVDDWFKNNNIKNRQDHPEMYVKLIVVTLAYPIFYYIALTTSSVLTRYLALTVATFALSHWGISVMHDGCHGAFSKNKIMSKAASYWLDLMGISSFVWKHQHNIGHHAHTNTEDDPDAITAHPMIRVSPHRPWKPWHQFQQYYAWVLFAFVAIRWVIRDIEVVVSGRYDDIPLMKMNTQEKTVFIVSKIWFFIAYLAIPVQALGLTEGLIFFFWIEIIISEIFALQFTVNHYEGPAVFPSKNHQETDWATLQVQTTSNYGAGSYLAEVWSGGLNYQVEHHLFPSIAHPYYRHLSPILQQTCKEYGIQYINYPDFFSAVKGVFDHLRQWGTRPANC